MYIEFEKIPDSSRLWIYQCERTLGKEETDLVNNLTERFIEQWTAHQIDLTASFLFVENRFLLIAVNEEVQDASGCSIDASVRFIQELGRKVNAGFLDRRVPVVIENELVFFGMNELKNGVEKGEINENSIFYDNLVPTIAQWKDEWKKKAGQGWLKRFFKPVESFK